MLTVLLSLLLLLLLLFPLLLHSKMPEMSLNNNAFTFFLVARINISNLNYSEVKYEALMAKQRARTRGFQKSPAMQPSDLRPENPSTPS